MRHSSSNCRESSRRNSRSAARVRAPTRCCHAGSAPSGASAASCSGQREQPRQVAAKAAEVGADEAERMVDFVGDTGAELAQRRQALRLPQVVLQRLGCRDVGGDAEIVEETSRRVHPRHAADAEPDDAPVRAPARIPEVAKRAMRLGRAAVRGQSMVPNCSRPRPSQRVRPRALARGTPEIITGSCSAGANSSIRMRPKCDAQLYAKYSESNIASGRVGGGACHALRAMHALRAGWPGAWRRHGVRLPP